MDERQKTRAPAEPAGNAAHREGTDSGAAGGSTHGGGAGAGMRIREGARPPGGAGGAEEVTSAASEPAAAPQATRTSPSSGDRGTGGGLGDALGGARRATGAEMTRGGAGVGDEPVHIPPGGSATQGAAAGAGLSRGTAGVERPGDVDPGGGGDLTGAPPAAGGPAADPANSGLGGTMRGGSLEAYDAALGRDAEKDEQDADEQNGKENSGKSGRR